MAVLTEVWAGTHYVIASPIAYRLQISVKAHVKRISFVYRLKAGFEGLPEFLIGGFSEVPGCLHDESLVF